MAKKVTQSDEDMVESLLHDISLKRRCEGIIAGRPRQSPEQLAIPDRKLNFAEVEKCFTTEAAVKEAERCLRCYRIMLLAVTGKK